MIRGCLTCPLTTARCQTCAISLLTKVFGLFADEPVCQSLLHRLTSRVDLPTCYDQCNNKQTNLFILSFRLCFHILMKKEKRNKRKPDICGKDNRSTKKNFLNSGYYTYRIKENVHGETLRFISSRRTSKDTSANRPGLLAKRKSAKWKSAKWKSAKWKSANSE